MKAISKFMFAENPLNNEDLREFILHTEQPRFLAEIKENNFGFSFELAQKYDEITNEEFEELKYELERWWEEYLDWEESIDLEE